MKTIITLDLTLIATTAFSASHFKQNINGDDTMMHIGLGAGAAALTVYYLPKKMHPILKASLGILAGVAAGCVSESMDDNWSNKDLAQWGIGGAAGTAAMAIFYPVKFNF
jgi:hypothetical protein